MATKVVVDSGADNIDLSSSIIITQEELDRYANACLKDSCTLVRDYAKDHQLFVTDALVGADPAYKLQIKCINEHAWHHLFLKQLVIRPKTKLTTPAEFTLICMPSVKANPIEDGTHSETFIKLSIN